MDAFSDYSPVWYTCRFADLPGWLETHRGLQPDLTYHQPDTLVVFGFGLNVATKRNGYHRPQSYMEAWSELKFNQGYRMPRCEAYVRSIGGGHRVGNAILLFEDEARRFVEGMGESEVEIVPLTERADALNQLLDLNCKLAGLPAIYDRFSGQLR